MFPKVMTRGPYGAVLLFAAILIPMRGWGDDRARHDSASELARQVLKAADWHGGLIVHLDCGDGRLTAALYRDHGGVVQGLETDPEKVAPARECIRKLGIYGPVSVDRCEGKRLPIQVRAMIVAGKTLFVAGPPVGTSVGPWDRGEGKPSLLLAVSASDGDVAAQTELPGTPVLDGLAAAGGRLFVCLESGRFVCLE